jgi:hypothetical protein
VPWFQIFSEAGWDKQEKAGYFCLLRIDVGDAAPGFESLIYTTLNSAFDKFRYIFDSNTGTYWYYPEDVKLLEHGNRWPEIPSYKN